jgi:two-component system, sensor histidine kinase and response regulator
MEIVSFNPAIPVTDYAGDILVVDDTPDNLRLLSTILTEHRYKVRRVVNGAQALDAVSLNPPELILLDILMPDLSGFEVCETLKSNPLTADIPIIFLSALNDTADKKKAFTLGGADYITKPFQILEVLARVDHQITISRQRLTLHQREQELLELNQTLSTRVEERTEAIGRLLNQLQLQIQDRVEYETKIHQQDLELNEIKTRFVQQVFHEFRTPLSVISMSAEFLGKENITAEQRTRKLEMILASVVRLDKILVNFTSLEKYNESTTTRNIPKLNLTDYFEKKIIDWQRVAGDLFQIEYLPQQILPTSICLDSNFLNGALEQLIANSIRYSPKGGKILIKVQLTQNQIIIIIHDWGIGIPENEQQYVFEQFYRARNANSIPGTPGVGIGLTIAKQIVNFQGGDIEIFSTENEGTAVKVTLPYVTSA